MADQLRFEFDGLVGELTPDGAELIELLADQAVLQGLVSSRQEYIDPIRLAIVQEVMMRIANRGLGPHLYQGENAHVQ